MDNRIDRVIGELTEMVDRIMGQPMPRPWPTGLKEYLPQATQTMVVSGLAVPRGRTGTNVITGS